MNNIESVNEMLGKQGGCFMEMPLDNGSKGILILKDFYKNTSIKTLCLSSDIQKTITCKNELMFANCFPAELFEHEEKEEQKSVALKCNFFFDAEPFCANSESLAKLIQRIRLFFEFGVSFFIINLYYAPTQANELTFEALKALCKELGVKILVTHKA